mmetsp:Transcript_14800/g.58050  ORF Transcript_14800/g.58050 Transcript_14800/m.58050 type:complete len:461 (+) Transcript_14800:459-1841(+)
MRGEPADGLRTSSPRSSVLPRLPFGFLGSEWEARGMVTASLAMRTCGAASSSPATSSAAASTGPSTASASAAVSASASALAFGDSWRTTGTGVGEEEEARLLARKPIMLDRRLAESSRLSEEGFRLEGELSLLAEGSDMERARFSASRPHFLSFSVFISTSGLTPAAKEETASEEGELDIAIFKSVEELWSLDLFLLVSESGVVCFALAVCDPSESFFMPFCLLFSSFSRCFRSALRSITSGSPPSVRFTRPASVCEISAEWPVGAGFLCTGIVPSLAIVERTAVETCVGTPAAIFSCAPWPFGELGGESASESNDFSSLRLWVSDITFLGDSGCGRGGAVDTSSSYQFLIALRSDSHFTMNWPLAAAKNHDLPRVVTWKQNFLPTSRSAAGTIFSGCDSKMTSTGSHCSAESYRKRKLSLRRIQRLCHLERLSAAFLVSRTPLWPLQNWLMASFSPYTR